MTNGQRGALTRRATLVAAAAGFGAVAFVDSAKAQVAPKTFVLVHGSWHGGWCWRRVSDRLEKLGHKVYTPTLTGLGERSHLLDEKVNLTTHITDIVNVIKWERLSNVVLCGHSYAGYPVSGALEMIGSAVSSIVFLDSFLPDNGDSILEKGNPRVAESIRAAVEKKQLSLPPLPASFFQVNEADRAWVDSMCTPQPLGTYTEKLMLTGARERVAKKTYIRAKGYSQPIFDAAEEKLKTDPTWRVLPVQSGHDVMVDAPDRLVEMLLEAA
jgi:pimeloyl-ACP methyl ester carboxylesterase